MAKYWQDLDRYGLLDVGLRKYFNIIKQIPYKEDELGTELVARPLYLLDKQKFRKLDCKKKSILIGSYLNAHGYKPGGKKGKAWRVVAVSEKPNKQVHHVFIQGRIGGQWRNIDPTYSDYTLFEGKPNVTYAEELLQ